jgi:ABC-2 type transport system permease protein
VTLWRLEWLRLLRTYRLLALVGVFGFFGVVGPLLGRYRDELLRSAGGGQSGLTITAPPPVPADGIINYVSQATQIGLLVFALVAAGALAFDADRERAVFLRTRVRRVGRLVLVKYAVNVLAGSGAFAAGALVAWYGTAVLLGSLPAGAMVAGIALTGLYFAFLAALVALIAGRTTSVAAPAIGALAVALSLALLGANRRLAQWLPSRLVGVLADVATGTPVADYLGAAAVTAAATAGLLAGAVALNERREL